MDTTSQIAMLALQIGVIIIASKYLGQLTAKLGLPSVLGELVAGVIIGPYLLGNLPLPGYPDGLFPRPEAGGLPVALPLYSLATLGSIVLLFMSGLETDIKMFFRYSVVGTMVGLGGVIGSFVLGVLLAKVMYDNCGIMDPRALFLGILSTATSVGITARILSDKKSMDSPEGTTIMAAAVIDDVLGIICLAIVMGIVSGGNAGAADAQNIGWLNIGFITLKSVGLWLGFTAVGLIVAHPLAKLLRKSCGGHAYAILAFSIALLLAGFFQNCGLAMIIGAYVAGLTFSKTDLSFSIQEHLHSLYDFLVPIFFVIMGMTINISVFAQWDILKYGLIFSLLAVLGKVVGCMLPSLFMNFNFLGAVRIGVGMIPRGEVALIIAGIGTTTLMTVNGKQVPIVDDELFGIAIIMTMMTTLVAPPLLSAVLSIKGKGTRKEKPNLQLLHVDFPMPSITVRDFLVRQLVDNFRLEGFRHSKYSADSDQINFRKGANAFNMTANPDNISFEFVAKDRATIMSVFNETSVELFHDMEEIQRMALPHNADTRYSSIVPYTGKDEAALASIIPQNCVIVDLQASNYKGALEELIRHLFRCGYVKCFDECFADVMEREGLETTVMEGGLAMPHARSNSVEKMVSVIALCPNNEIVEEGHSEPIKLIVLTVTPKNRKSPYMQYISHIASMLCNTDPKELLAIKDPVQLRKRFLV